MTTKSFDNIMLIGRAGAGKSELIDFLKNVPERERLEKYHIGSFSEIDDFPWLFSLFKDEDLWEQLGRPRKYARKENKIYVTLDYEIYNFTTLKLNRTVQEMLSENKDFHENKTLFIEYARGRTDGFKTSLNLFDVPVLEKTAIFFLDNTFEESMRRNTVRSSSKDSEQTILHHKIPLEVMEKYYTTHDWYDLTKKESHGYIERKNVKIPFVTVWNIPESHDFKVLEERYSPALKKLWEQYTKRYVK